VLLLRNRESRDTMIRNILSVTACIAFTLATNSSSANAQSQFRVVSYMQQFGPAVGLVESSPGIFVSTTGDRVFTVNTNGAKSILTSVRSSIDGPFVSGANQRFYSAAELSITISRVLSVGLGPGKIEYSDQSFVPVLTQNLPDAALLDIAAERSNFYLVKSSLSGNITIIYQFDAGEFLPNTAIYGSDGNFYGISVLQDGSGYVYRVTPSGSRTNVIQLSVGSFVGFYHFVPLLQATDGNLYGATPNGGVNGTGTIFKVTLSGKYTLLYSFPKGSKGMPTALIEASDGNFYGSTLGINGGDSLLFRITPSGQYSVAYAMTNLAADGDCLCLLTQGSDGIIYGTAQIGGITGFGDIFALDVGLPKPAPHAQHFNPPAGPAGTRVLLWGNNLLSATVQFNNMAATQVSSSGPNYVWATVPLGATSGPITTTTPGGSFTTSESFTVQ
jgi:uncharacterized repeat protein (TIGR03803 family)